MSQDHPTRRALLGGAGLLVGAAAACRPLRDPYAPHKPPVPVAPNLRAGSETQVLSTCGLCPAGCGIRVRVVEGRAVKVEGNPASPVNRGRICARGQAALELLYHPDRVRSPMRRAGARGEQRWQPLPWDEAIAWLATELDLLRARGEPQSLVLVDGEERGATHALWSRFMRAFGSPNHLGHGATGAGGTARAMSALTARPALPGYDFENARLVLLVGTGALEASPQSMHLARAVASGARPWLLCAWPRLPPSAALVDEWLALAPGGQAAFLLAIAYVLLREGLGDDSALPGTAPGSGPADTAWRERILADFSPQQVAPRVGVSAQRIERLARELAAVRPSLVAVDETTSDEATAAAGLLLNGLLGSLGAAGGVLLDGAGDVPAWGSCALDRTAELGLRARTVDGRDAAHGGVEASRLLALPGAILSGKPYPVKALLLHYSNPVFSKPDGARWRQALAKVPLVVSFSPLLDESARLADLILPDHTFLEAWDLIVPGRGLPGLSLRQPAVRPLRNSLQTGEVILRLAHALESGVAAAFPWTSYQQAVEAGCAELTGGASDVVATLDRDGVWLPPPTAPTSGPSLRWSALLGDRLVPPRLPAGADAAAFPFVLVPYRGAGYAEGGMRHLPWLAELASAERDPWQPCIELSTQDARGLGIADGDGVIVESPFGQLAMRAQVHDGVRPGVLALPLGGGAWPLTSAEPHAASLLGSMTDEATGQWLASATRARIARMA